MLEPRLLDLKRSGEREDGFALLHRGHAACREAPPVAQAVDLVDDGPIELACPNEVAVRGMNGAVRGHRLRRGRESLSEDLAAEDCSPPEDVAGATKEIPVDTLEGQQIDEILEERMHASSLLPDRTGDYGTQWNALPVPLPVQLPDAHPAQLAHRAPLGHCESLVHQHGTPAAVHLPLGEDTLSQLPIEQDQALATDVAVTQPSLSAVPLPEHVPVHLPSALTHFPLEQLESATQRHAVLPELGTGAGVRVVVHIVPPVPVQGTELGAGSQPCPSSVPVPVQPEQLPLWPLGMQWPLSHTESDVQ